MRSCATTVYRCAAGTRIVLLVRLLACWLLKMTMRAAEQAPSLS